MPSTSELRALQKSELFRILKLKSINDNLDFKSSEIDTMIKTMIIELKAPMEAEDVAYVEKLIAEFNGVYKTSQSQH